MLARRVGVSSSVTVVSTLIQPVGPEPPGVYWRRRAAVVLVVVVLLVGLWWIFRPGGGEAEPAASASPSATPTPTPSPTASPTASASPSGSPSASGTGQVADCKDSVIEVEASTGSESYPAGSSAKLTLKVTNGGTVPCLRDLGPGANQLKVSSGGVHVWSSDDCNPNDASDVQTMDPGESFTTTVTWDGTLSQAGCPAGQSTAQPGGYDLVGRNGDVESPKVPFALT